MPLKLCSSHIKIWNHANHIKKKTNQKHKNAKFIGEKLKAKGFAQASCTELTLPILMILRLAKSAGSHFNFMIRVCYRHLHDHRCPKGKKIGWQRHPCLQLYYDISKMNINRMIFFYFWAVCNAASWSLGR